MQQTPLPAFHLSLGKECGQLRLHSRILRREEYAGSTLIQSVNNARAQRRVVLSVLQVHRGRKLSVLLRQVVNQRVHEGAVPAAGSRVHHHPRRFTDRNYVIIFEQNLSCLVGVAGECVRTKITIPERRKSSRK